MARLEQLSKDLHRSCSSKHPRPGPILWPGVHLVERFTRVETDKLLYEYTIDDPESFERTWSAAIPMVKTDGPMFEYACHEGNTACSISSRERAPQKRPLRPLWKLRRRHLKKQP